MFDAWTRGELTQAEIARTLDEADRLAGGDGVSVSTVQKSIQRRRAANEDVLINNARYR